MASAEMESELYPGVVLRLGPLEVTTTVVATWAIMAALIILAWALRKRLAVRAGRAQAVAESLVGLVVDTIRSTAPDDPWRIVPLVGTLGLFVGVANSVDFVPGVSAPTADISTTCALAVVVFLSVPFYGIRAQGLTGYLKEYAEPTPLMLPFHVISEISRTIALAIRLFGNIMSLSLVVAVLMLVAAAVVPVPIMALGLLTGLIQAYIFSVLTSVYVGAGLHARKPHGAAPHGAKKEHI